MSYTNGTTHYNLPQTTGSDKRDWSDTNQAFQDVDAALYGAVQDVAQTASDVDALEARMDTAEQNISTNTGDIAGLDTRVTTVEGAVSSLSGQVTDTRQDLEDMICAYNEASATSTHDYAVGDYFIYNDVLYRAIQAITIGDTIVPDTNCTTTNVTTEIKPVKIGTVVSDGVKTYGAMALEICNLISVIDSEHEYKVVDTSGSEIKIYRNTHKYISGSEKKFNFQTFVDTSTDTNLNQRMYSFGCVYDSGLQANRGLFNGVATTGTFGGTITTVAVNYTPQVPAANAEKYEIFMYKI